MTYIPVHRMKRLRKTAHTRGMLRETRLQTANLIAPLFIHAGLSTKEPILSMPGHYQLTLKDLDEEIASLSALGIPAVLLFGIPSYKDATGSASLNNEGIIQQSIRRIKAIHPDMLVIADVCFCEYTDHGHCGILAGDAINNDATLKQLALQAVSYAKAGVDWVAPSAMADGMVGAIRQALDQHGFQDVAILSYAVKYSSHLYGPFRDAAQSAPQFGDRQSYMMDPANGRESLREASLDIQEGTDLLMVKPAMLYLDVIYRIKHAFPEVPLCAYQVSGEFAMIKAAAQQGYLDENAVILESITAMQRAGADLIITYFAKSLAKILGKQ